LRLRSIASMKAAMKHLSGADADHAAGLLHRAKFLL